MRSDLCLHILLHLMSEPVVQLIKHNMADISSEAWAQAHLHPLPHRVYLPLYIYILKFYQT